MSNALADAKAEVGAENEALNARHQTMQQAEQDIRSVLAYMAAFLAKVRGEEGRGWLDADLPLYQRKESWRLDFSGFPGHRLGTSADSKGCLKATCLCCGRSAHTMATRFRMGVEPCFGHKIERLPASKSSAWLVAKGHLFMRTGSYYFCGKCGYHSSQRLHKLDVECKRAPASDQQKRRLAYMTKGYDPTGYVFLGGPFRVKRGDRNYISSMPLSCL